MICVCWGFCAINYGRAQCRINFSDSMKRVASKLERITDHASVTLAEFDKDLRYIFVNQSYAKMHGATPSEILGEEVEKVMGDTAFADAKPRMGAALKGEAIEYDFQLEDAGEQRRYFRVKYAPEIDENGEVGSVIAAITDNTAEVMAQIKVNGHARGWLQPMTFLLMDLWFFGPSGMQIDITDFRFEYANDAGAKIAGDR